MWYNEYFGHIPLKIDSLLLFVFHPVELLIRLQSYPKLQPVIRKDLKYRVTCCCRDGITDAKEATHVV
jgi:hypothetical protein